MKICPKCNSEHSKPGKFCSRKCANSRSFSDDAKLKKSIATTEYFSALPSSNKEQKRKQFAAVSCYKVDGPYTKIKLAKCSHCEKDFWSNNSKTTKYNTTCSDECFLAVKRKNRAGSKTEYNGETYDSSWEADLAKWMDENGIKFERPKTHIMWVDSLGKARKYFPDFYLPGLDLFVDPKNKFCIADQQEKLDFVSKNINLIYGEVDQIKNRIMRG